MSTFPAVIPPRDPGARLARPGMTLGCLTERLCPWSPAGPEHRPHRLTTRADRGPKSEGPAASSSGGGFRTRSIAHDREAHVAAMAVLFRERAPRLLRGFAARKRALHLLGAMHQRVEIERAELPADDPVLTACHDVSPLCAFIS